MNIFFSLIYKDEIKEKILFKILFDWFCSIKYKVKSSKLNIWIYEYIWIYK